MKFAIAFFLALACVIIAGCAVTPHTPQQTVYQIESEYQVVLAAAVAYKHLPACGGSAPLICADPAVVAKLQQADTTASAAIFAAQAAVRDPNFDKSKADAVLIAAEQALAVLTAITPKVKK